MSDPSATWDDANAHGILEKMEFSTSKEVTV